MQREILSTIFVAIAVLVLAAISLNVGASKMNLLHLITDPSDKLSKILFVSRVPRTIALILAGAALAISGLLMQMMARNYLLEPATIGSFSAATFGMVISFVISPSLALLPKFLIVSLCTVIGTSIFLLIIKRIPSRSSLLVPLVGLVLASIIYSVSVLLAYKFEIQQAIVSWGLGDFSTILKGKYDLLWVAAFITLVAIYMADRFTVLGLGEDFATNIGVNYRNLMFLGVIIVSVISASIMITTGAIPFIGIIIPNIVRHFIGDNIRKSIILIALLGSACMLIFDLLGRLIIHPFEVPSSNLLNIAGCIFLIALLIKGRRKWA